MPDQNRDAARILGKDHQVERTFAQLRGAARSARQVTLVDRLNRINHKHLRLEFLRLLQDFFEASFAKQKHIGARYVQALAAELDLNRALFAAYIKRLDAGGCHGGECRKHQRGLTDARIATNEHQGTWCKPAPQHAVKFGIGGAQPPRIFGRDLLERHHLVHRTTQAARGSTALENIFDHVFLEAAPCTAERALARPLRRGVAAFGAKELNFFFRFRLI